MASTKLSAVQEKGQITIPITIRKKLGLKKGDLVAFIETKQGVVISPQETLAMGALDRIGDALKKRGVRLDELIESGRKMRGQIVKEKYGIETNGDR